MTGLVIGKSSGFSKEFSEKLKTTGTTHLVALSGYNISTVLNWFTVLFGLFLLRKRAMWLSVFAVIAFVLMTGAEASVVRAAIMAVIVVVAKQIERPHSVGNAIVFTALVMILINPRVLVFDIGFQLSFTALVGIVYVKPALDVLFKRNMKNSGFLKWKENLTTTFAAQIAVLPILLMNFGFVTPIGIITNVLLLTFIPPTMALGVIILIANFFSDSLAFVASIPARIFLGYELGVINLFSKFDFGYDVGATSAVFALIYYTFMIGGILWINKRNEGVTTDKGGAKIKTNDI
jgi:competence protein ComEC